MTIDDQDKTQQTSETADQAAAEEPAQEYATAQTSQQATQHATQASAAPAGQGATAQQVATTSQEAYDQGQSPKATPPPVAHGPLEMWEKAEELVGALAAVIPEELQPNLAQAQEAIASAKRQLAIYIEPTPSPQLTQRLIRQWNKAQGTVTAIIALTKDSRSDEETLEHVEGILKHWDFIDRHMQDLFQEKKSSSEQTTAARGETQP